MEERTSLMSQRCMHDLSPITCVQHCMSSIWYWNPLITSLPLVSLAEGVEIFWQTVSVLQRYILYRHLIEQLHGKRAATQIGVSCVNVHFYLLVKYNCIKSIYRVGATVLRRSASLTSLSRTFCFNALRLTNVGRTITYSVPCT